MNEKIRFNFKVGYVRSSGPQEFMGYMGGIVVVWLKRYLVGGLV